MNKKQKSLVNAAIVKHFDISDEIQKLINVACFDLYYGPGSTTEMCEAEEGVNYQGFQKACKQIRDSVELHKVWVLDLFSETDTIDSLTVADKEPHWNCGGAECDGEFPEDWTSYTLIEVKEIVFGKALAGYI